MSAVAAAVPSRTSKFPYLPPTSPPSSPFLSSSFPRPGHPAPTAALGKRSSWWGVGAPSRSPIRLPRASGEMASGAFLAQAAGAGPGGGPVILLASETPSTETTSNNE
uniref:Double homeobox protein 4C-like isoform X3 n=1 Tax=Phascolarctos cinereus TaxID=38626 RepID=A0A6P5LU31_PHACI|nr:double homeobox protein 4C-like isoform X3 [Phascolarctos cinereus]